MKEKKSQADLEWKKRTLCADESCIGVVGPDGRCKECGLPFDGPLPDPDVQPLPEAEEPASEREAGDDETAAEPEESDDAAMSQADLEWEKRTLCVDESCIGVIGPDGRCKECGKAFENGR